MVGADIVVVDRTPFVGMLTGALTNNLESMATWLTMTPEARPALRNTVCEIRLDRLKRRSRSFELRNDFLILSPLVKPYLNPWRLNAPTLGTYLTIPTLWPESALCFSVSHRISEFSRPVGRNF